MTLGQMNVDINNSHHQQAVFVRKHEFADLAC